MSSPLTARRWAWTIGLLALLTLTIAHLGVSVGSQGAAGRRVKVQGEAASVDRDILHIRLTRVLVGLLAGGALATAGTVLQALFRNPLADPFVLGTSGGAAFGAVVGIVLLENAGPAWGWLSPSRESQLLCVPMMAFLGSLLSVAVVSASAAGRGSLPTQSLLLIGVIANYVFTALVLLLTLKADPNKLPRIEAWLMGDLSGGSFLASGVGALLAVCMAICVVLTLWLARPLDALTLGDEQARSLGVPVGRVRWAAFLLSSLATAIAVAIAGVIGFVGLLLPHGFRRIFGADHRLLVPACFLGGGSLLVLCDIPARTLFHPALPVGVVTAILGGPLFYLILRRRAA